MKVSFLDHPRHRLQKLGKKMMGENHRGQIRLVVRMNPNRFHKKAGKKNRVLHLILKNLKAGLYRWLNLKKL